MLLVEGGSVKLFGGSDGLFGRLELDEGETGQAVNKRVISAAKRQHTLQTVPGHPSA